MYIKNLLQQEEGRGRLLEMPREKSPYGTVSQMKI
jgi:hypothetical protein